MAHSTVVSTARTSIDVTIDTQASRGELPEAFDEYFVALFGDRWSRLVEALRRPTRHVALLNPHHSNPETSLPSEADPCDSLEGVRLVPEDVSSLPSLDSSSPEEPTPYYLMDAASVLAARALEIDTGHRVLDLCAAPGGKTLVAAFEATEKGFVVANDRSASRRDRLHETLETHLPDPMRRRVRVTGHDARKWGLHQQGLYDRVLVDAPCSGERHLLRDLDRLCEWSSGRPEQMAHRQYPMLCAALDAVRVGGRIVYATCALSPTENDGVVEQLLERSPERVEVLDLELPIGEPTDRGWRILPDETAGWGPMFVAALERIA